MVVAELGSLSRASLRLNVPQPTLSRHLSQLEDELRAPLFYRNGRGATLTDFGRQFLDSFAPVLGEFEARRGALLAEGPGRGGLVRLGIPPSIGRSIGASIVAEFSRRCPKAELQVRESFSGTLAEWLEAAELDVAILYDAKRSNHLSVTPLLREQVFLVNKAARGGGAPVDLADVDTARLILPSRSQGMRRVVETAYEAARLPLGWRMEIDSVATMKELVEICDFCAFLPYGAFHREVDQGRLEASPVMMPEAMTAELVLGTAHSRPVTLATRSLIGVIEEQVRTFVDRGILRGSPRPGRPRIVPMARGDRRTAAAAG